jgi:hypothetical protein
VYTSRTIGTAVYLYFRGFNADPGQFSIVSNEKDPLKGVDIKYVAETKVPYNKNLLYSPIPFELLQTYETKP